MIMLRVEISLPQPVGPDRFLAKAEAFHTRFPKPLPDLTAEGKRSGRKYEDDLPDDRSPANDASSGEASP